MFYLTFMHQLTNCLLLVEVGLLYARKTIFDIPEQMSAKLVPKSPPLGFQVFQLHPALVPPENVPTYIIE